MKTSWKDIQEFAESLANHISKGCKNLLHLQKGCVVLINREPYIVEDVESRSDNYVEYKLKGKHHALYLEYDDGFIQVWKPITGSEKTKLLGVLGDLEPIEHYVEDGIQFYTYHHAGNTYCVEREKSGELYVSCLLEDVKVELP